MKFLIIENIITSSVMGSIFDVASSRHTIYLFYKIIRRKLITCFSPFDKLLPDLEIIKSKLDPVMFNSLA